MCLTQTSWSSLIEGLPLSFRDMFGFSWFILLEISPLFKITTKTTDVLMPCISISKHASEINRVISRYMCWMLGDKICLLLLAKRRCVRNYFNELSSLILWLDRCFIVDFLRMCYVSALLVFLEDTAMTIAFSNVLASSSADIKYSVVLSFLLCILLKDWQKSSCYHLCCLKISRKLLPSFTSSSKLCIDVGLSAIMTESSYQIAPEITATLD